jgi:hypothetical protein
VHVHVDPESTFPVIQVKQVVAVVKQVTHGDAHGKHVDPDI